MCGPRCLTTLRPSMACYRNSFAFIFTQEIFCILWNPKFHNRVHKNPPLIPIFIQMTEVHTINAYIRKIHFCICYVVGPTTSNLCSDSTAVTTVMPFVPYGGWRLIISHFLGAFTIFTVCSLRPWLLVHICLSNGRVAGRCSQGMK
jgi:hypothetical protein